MKDNAMYCGKVIGEGKKVALFIQVSLNQYKIIALYTSKISRFIDPKQEIKHNHHFF
jgi:hypothetical protein